MITLFIISLSNVLVERDTAFENNLNFWFYSSCLATSGIEVLTFYISPNLKGGIPILLTLGAGGGGCVVYSYSAYTLTPNKEMKGKVFDTAVKGGIMGAFVGLGAIIALKFFNIP